VADIHIERATRNVANGDAGETAEVAFDSVFPGVCLVSGFLFGGNVIPLESGVGPPSEALIEERGRFGKKLVAVQREGFDVRCRS
jgi:hypothetical protein